MRDAEQAFARLVSPRKSVGPADILDGCAIHIQFLVSESRSTSWSRFR